MKPLASQIRILSFYTWLLAAALVFLQYSYFDVVSFAATVFVITTAAVLFMRNANHRVLKVILTLFGFLLDFVISLVIMIIAEKMFLRSVRLSKNGYTIIAVLIAAYVTAGLMGGVMRAAAKRPLKRSTAAGRAMEAAQVEASTATPTAIITHDTLPTRALIEWMAWALTHARTPESRMYATLAGALRAVEAGKDQAAIKVAATATAEAWAVPTNVKLLDVEIEAVESSDIWGSLNVEAESQLMAATAAFLRALEIGKSKVEAEAAAKKASIHWAPVKPPAPTPVRGDANAERTGMVQGFMRRVEKVTLGIDPFGIRGLNGMAPMKTMNKMVWSFGLVRQGTGANGRRLSPIQVRMEGYEIDGMLEDGDIVELPKTPVAAEVNTYAHLRNISKGVELVARSIEKAPTYQNYRWLTVSIMVFMLLLVGFLAFGMISEFNKQAAPIRQMFPH